MEPVPVDKMKQILKHTWADFEKERDMKIQNMGVKKGKYAEIGEKIGRLVDDKQVQYGDSFGKTVKILNVYYPEGIKPEQYPILLGQIRMFDKHSRLSTGLADTEDPIQDIAGYALLLKGMDNGEET